MQDQTAIREHAQRIIESGVLGRSRSYVRLLEYLVECTAAGHTPKELEIATEVFGRGADFDPSQDSMVRVYAHNLRQKLEQYYTTPGREETQRIVIPRGEYRIALQTTEAVEPEDSSPPAQPSRWRRVAAGIGLIALGVVLGIAFSPRDQRAHSVFAQVADSPVWADMLRDDIPILVVVGDYYIFAELDERGNVTRLRREFMINSRRDLDDYVMYGLEPDARFLDLDLTYLPRASAAALRDVLRIVYTSDKPVEIVSMSELNVARLRTSHIIYVGYISALDKLLDFVFAASSLEVGGTFDELVQRDSGQLFASGAGYPGAFRNYRDYGFFSTFPGPSGHRVTVIAGTRDTGLMHTAYAMTDPLQLSLIEQTVDPQQAAMPLAFELLYEVNGIDRTNLDGTLVHAARLDHQSIWIADGSLRR